MPLLPAPVLRIADPAQAVFVSDMHLDDHDPALMTRFLDALDAWLAASTGPGSPAATTTGNGRSRTTGGASAAAGRADNGGLAHAGAEVVAASADTADGEVSGPLLEGPVLFLLGDLFEYWVGDDVPGEAGDQLARRLQALASRGGHGFLMQGNRDFLMDAPLPARPDVLPYSQRCAATLLPDPCVIEVAGKRVLLSHGDLLCTDDLPYQAWRTQCRQPAWQAQMLAQPAEARLAMAQALRQQSHQQQASSGLLTDVNQAAVDALMQETGCLSLIHGHTHRPALHHWQHDGHTRLRWVLPDWGSGPQARGALLSLADAVSGQILSAATAAP
ncbi:MAG: UDP-2,3-diacylglucosamine diphosphatase [Lautropia sp.]|nr:UDP-2,3-diacylglucosamine diphosphatase [Lautropia sp.]